MDILLTTAGVAVTGAIVFVGIRILRSERAGLEGGTTSMSLGGVSSDQLAAIVEQAVVRSLDRRLPEIFETQRRTLQQLATTERVFLTGIGSVGVHVVATTATTTDDQGRSITVEEMLRGVEGVEDIESY